MNKIYYSLAIVSVALSLSVSAQDLENGNLENWVTLRDGYDDPNSWGTSNKYTTSLGSGAGVSKSSDAFEGSFAAKLQTVGVGFAGQPYPVFMVNGSPSRDQITGQPDLASAGTPVKSKPVALTGYYKFDQIFPNDSGRAVIMLKKMGTKKSDTVAIGYKGFGPASSWTAFRIELVDLMPGVNPDSAVVAFWSTNPLDPKQSGSLYLDSLAFDLATGVDPLEIPTSINLYPNPVTDRVIVEIEDPNFAREVVVFSAVGQHVGNWQLTGQRTEIDFSHLAPGLYSYRLNTNNTSRPAGTFMVK